MVKRVTKYTLSIVDYFYTGKINVDKTALKDFIFNLFYSCLKKIEAYEINYQNY